MVRSKPDTDSTEIFDNNEIRIGTFTPHNTDCYAYRNGDDYWCVNSYGPHGGGDHRMEEDSVSKTISATAHQYDDISPFTEAMVRADTIAQKTSLTRKQAEVYVVREDLEWSRGETSTRYRMSTSNVDEHLRVARQKIDQARELVELIE